MLPETAFKPEHFGLLVWLAIVFCAGAVGAAASIHADVFYALLVHPSWAPPAWVFGPVWTLLYALMAWAAWSVWSKLGFQSSRFALSIFIVQLVLNALWSWLFFGWHRGALAFAEVLLLWILIVATLISFWRIKPMAGAMLIPYLLWVSFASALNYSVWQLNPLLLG